ncbi:MAG TPA: PLP-dependent aminotransferase family protein [Blastocatellia bacterium]|nr:PLP-dependent aminotransferase family protein [Blastocatellia bacterium]
MELAITLDNRSAVPLHRQIYEEIRKSILTGRLAAGEVVPSTRSLARSLGVSRSTVTQSYDQLVSEGYLETLVGSGTKVSRQLPDDLLQTPPPLPPGERARAGASQPHSPKLSPYGESLRRTEPFEPREPQMPINFQNGLPALDQFPLTVWRRLLLRHCRADPSKLLNYADDPQGDPGLRAAIAGYLARSRAVRCQAEQIVIVNGSQQAIDLVTKVLVDRGDQVILENPGYLGARRAFLAQGAKLRPVPVDESGIIIEKLPEPSATVAKLIYVTPSHQFPTGAVLSLPRRLELIAWAAESGSVIIEDDYDSEFRYGDRPIPALQGLDEHDHVIYVGTFSKVLFPSLRVGYLVVPPPLAPIFKQARWLADRHTPTLEQWALTDFINEGQLERHLRRMRTLYDRRRQTLVEALKHHFEDRVLIIGQNAGMHLMAQFKTDLDDQEFLRRANQAGVGLVSARAYYLGDLGQGEFVLGYANLSERKIQEGIRRLAKILR